MNRIAQVFVETYFSNFYHIRNLVQIYSIDVTLVKNLASSKTQNHNVGIGISFSSGFQAIKYDPFFNKMREHILCVEILFITRFSDFAS